MVLNKKFWYATASLVTSTVGVGIFGLPFSFAKSGFLVGTIFLILVAGLTLLTNWIYGEIVLRTESKHQLVGYTRLYLGHSFQKVIFFAAVFTGYSALLAYIVIAGDFLNTIFSSFFYASVQTYSLIFFVVAAALVLRGLKTVSKADFIGALFLIIVVVAILVTGFPHIQRDNFSGLNYDFWFLPYGVLLFAFAGLLGVPIQSEILGPHKHQLRKSITFAVAIIALIYFVFSLVVVGISGDSTTPDVVSGLYEYIGPLISFLIAAFGIFAISTAFLMLGTGLLEVFNFDFEIPRVKAWALVVFPPVILYVAGIRTFISIIGLAGAVAIALEAIILIFVYVRSKSHGNRVPEYSLDLPKWLLYSLIVLFLAGMVYAFIS